MTERYIAIEQQLLEKAVVLIEEMIASVNSPALEKVIANLVVEAWNISYFPEAGIEAEIKAIKKWYDQQGYLSEKQTEEILRKAISRKWEITKGIEWEGLWTRIENWQRKKLKSGKKWWELELEFWE